MKSYKVLRWLVLVNVSALGACGGMSSIGSGDEPRMNAGGAKGEGASSGAGGKVGAAGKGSGMGATSSMAGKPGNGTGAAPGVDLCMTDMDCPGSDAPCEMCPDGTTSCNKTNCVGGRCVTTMVGACGVECGADRDCPVPDVACTDCGDGSRACPISQCLMGWCQTSYPGCGTIDPCEGLSCGAGCKSCGPDGMCDASVATYCSAEGKCQPGLPQCGGGGMCATSMDCGAPPPVCVACGNDTCAAFDCIANKCVFTCPPNPNPQCKLSEDCPIIDDDCKMCAGGMCAVQACLAGSCQLVCPVN